MATEISIPSKPKQSQSQNSGLAKSELSFSQRLRQWRNGKIANPRFRRMVERFWLTRRFANKQANDLFKITAGFVYSQILFACVELKLFAFLFEGPKTIKQITNHVNANGRSLEISQLAPLLNAAKSLKLLTKDANELWMLDDLGAVIHADDGIRAMISHHAMLYNDLADPLALLAKSDTPTQTSQYWAYATASEPEKASNTQIAPYSELMRHSQSMLAETVIDAFPFGNYQSLMDVGGGDGTFLWHVLQRHPSIKVKLFDLPAVAELASEKLKSLSPKAQFEAKGGDFFELDMDATTDIVSLIRVLCDHNDTNVMRLLRNLYRSCSSNTQILIAEAMDGDSEGERLASAYFNMYFAAMRSGQGRTPAKLRSMLLEAGFSKSHVIKTSNPLFATLIVAGK